MLGTPVLGLLALAASPVTIFNPNCTTPDPYKCVGTANCGWCGASFSCMPGDSSGPAALGLPCQKHPASNEPGRPWVGFWASSVADLERQDGYNTSGLELVDYRYYAGSVPPEGDMVCTHGGQRAVTPCLPDPDSPTECVKGRNSPHHWLGYRCDCPPGRSGMKCGGCSSDDGCPGGGTCVSPFAEGADDADVRMVCEIEDVYPAPIKGLLIDMSTNASVGIDYLGGALSMTKDATVALQFGGLTSSTLPRGAAISYANLHVVPHGNSTQGSVSVDVRASVVCASDADPLTSSALGVAATSSATSVPWDVKPWTLGFANDESPNVASLLTSALDGITDVSGCSVVLHLSVTQATGTSGHNGARVFKDLSSISSVPSLTIYYEPPTTAMQLGWAADSSCAVEVSVPTSFTDSNIGSCTRYDVAAGKDAADHNSCPHLRMEATAATTAAPCSLAINGVELLNACDTDKTAAYLDGGVCAASVDTAASSRAVGSGERRTEGAAALPRVHLREFRSPGLGCS